LSKVTAACREGTVDIACCALALAAVTGLSKDVKRWRTALRVTASASMVAVLGLGSTPAAHAAAAAASLSVEHAWQSGFIAHFTIVNSSAAPLADWRLEFDLPAGEGVSHTWNSSFTQTGSHVVLGPANWNRVIEPGGSATGGFRGVLSGAYSPPVNCVLNREYLCT
jgi:hypothetical protein